MNNLTKVHIDSHEDLDNIFSQSDSIDSTELYLQISDIMQNPNDSYFSLDFNKHKRIKSLFAYDLQNLEQIELFGKPDCEMFSLTVSNCPNISILPEQTSKVTIKGNCNVNELFDGRIIYKDIEYLYIMNNCRTNHISLKSLPALKYLCVHACNFEEISLHSLCSEVEICIYLCLRLEKITHENTDIGKTKLFIRIYDSLVPAFLPSFTNTLVLSYTFENFSKRDMLMKQYGMIMSSGSRTLKCKIQLPKYLKTLNIINERFSKPMYIPLKYIYMPDNLECVQLERCGINDTSCFTNGLKVFKCYYCRFGKFALDNLPNSLETIHFYHCDLGNFASYPRQLKHLTVSKCELETVTVPNGLLSLDCSQNLITDIDNLPDSLEHLECGGNPIKMVKKLPYNLKHFSYNNSHCIFRIVKIYEFSPNIKFVVYAAILEQEEKPNHLLFFRLINHLRNTISKKMHRKQSISP